MLRLLSPRIMIPKKKKKKKKKNSGKYAFVWFGETCCLRACSFCSRHVFWLKRTTCHKSLSIKYLPVFRKGESFFLAAI